MLAWTQALYAPALAAVRRAKGSPPPAPRGEATPPVSLIVAAYREEAVIAAKVANALALDYPGLEVIAAVRVANGEIVAFSDANALWEPSALRELVAPFADPNVGYVCGQVTFTNDAGTNQEGLYWRYEM